MGVNAKKCFEKKDTVEPGFDKEAWHSFFKKISHVIKKSENWNLHLGWKTEWTTSLIHEKSSDMEPSNFHPITLKSVFPKIYSHLFAIQFTTFFLKIDLLSRTYRRVSGEQYQGQQSTQNYYNLYHQTR